FHLAHRRYAHRAIATDATQIIAEQIDNHDILGAVLRALLQFLHAQLILSRRGSAWPGALDGPGLDLAILQTQEPLRRGAGNRKIAQVEVTGKGSRIAGAQPKIVLRRG